MTMRPEYIAIQASIVRAFAREDGFNLPQMKDADLMAWFHREYEKWKLDNEAMPWCDGCQCYHHATAQHINRETSK